MLVLIPIILLLLTALIISLLGLFRPKFSYHWLIATGGVLLTFILLWTHRGAPAISKSMGGGQVGIVTLQPFFLQLDEVTWPFAMALVALCLAVLITDIGRAAETSWVVWAGDLAVTAVGLMAIMAENPLTLLIGWALVDVIELAILLRQVEEMEVRRRVVLFFAASVLGSMCVIGAVVGAGSQGLDLSFRIIPQQAQIFLVLAAGLRLGVFPLQVSFLSEIHHQRGQATLLRLIPPASSMPLLVYAAFTPVLPAWRILLLGFSVLAAVYGGVAWARARDELQGRVYWIIGLAGMMFYGALQFRPESAMAWGLAMLYAGGALFMASVRTRWMVSISVLSLLTISGLPFSPSNAGLGMYVPVNIFDLGALAAHAALLAGYFRFSTRVTQPLQGIERWVRVAYPAGLTLLPLTYLLSSFLAPTLPGAVTPSIWPLAGVMLILIAVVALRFRGITVPLEIMRRIDQVFSLRWLYPMLGWGYQTVGRIAREITLLLEGEGGVLWALVLLALLVSLFSQLSAGAGGL